jgi:hypothetical protein
MSKEIFALTVIILTFSACGLECIEKKTGFYKASENMKDAQRDKLFVFELRPQKKVINLGGSVFRIKNAWVENKWRLECIDGQAVVLKQDGFQVVIDADFPLIASDDEYYIELAGSSHAHGLHARLDFPYNGGDSLLFIISKSNSLDYKNRKELVRVVFAKQL